MRPELFVFLLGLVTGASFGGFVAFIVTMWCIGKALQREGGK